ncbi:cell division topological specificity factor MinE [Roseovarius aestuarii]|uniref:Cell division topological specificity factor n=1 Tax=Roseovarius aestuarii TaxID=475083 RepID=A0A1X7BW17_9RHOB|nr:cell division topological specificity factor MinE [Roseovarius aestuarii]SMC13813.1 Cell division topological specificity factor [Roseovarius aestuarii]
MSFFGFSFKPRRATSAQTAKDRLQVLLAHERRGGSTAPDYLSHLQSEIVEVIRKYVEVDDEGVDIRMEKGQDVSCLEINIELPCGATAVRGTQS